MKFAAVFDVVLGVRVTTMCVLRPFCGQCPFGWHYRHLYLPGYTYIYLSRSVAGCRRAGVLWLWLSVATTVSK